MKTRYFFLLAGLSALSFLSYAQGEGVGINGTGNAPDPSAGLDVDFTNKGFLPPRVTTIQRDQISDPALGLTVFNTTTNCLEFFVAGVWQPIGCGCSGPPSSPAEDEHFVTLDAITWNWNTVPGAIGYKWSTTNDYESATDVSTATSVEQIGLGCEASVTIYVWAYNACGGSSPLTLNTSTDPCAFICGNTINVVHTAGDISPVSKTTGYGTVSYNGKCWADRNLGADNVATSESDVSNTSAGWYWQYDRKQGYAVGPSPSWNANSITSSEWALENDPCAILMGEGWHIPTESEWGSADSFGGWSNYFQTYSSPLKIHAAGYLFTSDGTLQDRGSAGYYWAKASYGGTSGKTMRMGSSSSGIDSGYQASGFSVRCISDL